MAAYISFQPSDYFSPKIYTGTGKRNFSGLLPPHGNGQQAGCAMASARNR